MLDKLLDVMFDFEERTEKSAKVSDIFAILFHLSRSEIEKDLYYEADPDKRNYLGTKKIAEWMGFGIQKT